MSEDLPRRLATNAGAMSDAQIITATRRWIERAVIGLNLCPFARAPFAQQRVRLQVSHARDAGALVTDLRDEAARLVASDPALVETTLLMHPFVFGDFADYNDFLEVADALLDEMQLDGVLQIASFHPDYRFADAAADDVANCTNRSPWPTLHLLRESSITAAIETGIDTDAIWRRNAEALRILGHGGWRALWRDDASV